MYLVIGETPTIFTFTWGGGKNYNYKYLRVKVSDGSCVAEIIENINKRKKVTEQVERSKQINKNINIRIFKTIIETISTYSAETRIVSNRNERLTALL